MTRLGWGILLTILVVGGLFLSLLTFGGGAIPVVSRVDVSDDARPAMSEAAAAGGALVVPVQGVARGALRDNWGEARAEGARFHEGIDILAPRGTPVVAAAAGVVERLFESGDGGTTLYVRSGDRRWSYYYAHLDGYAADMREGLPVVAGQVLGYVGDTGNAAPGNTHLHFGVARKAADEGWSGGEAINPYPLLARGEPPR